MTFYAVIPAAGQSQRMGREKLRLPVGGQPILLRLVEAFRAGGVEKILVVLGPTSADLAERVQAAGGTAVCLPAATPDMRATVQHGLTWMTAH